MERLTDTVRRHLEAGRPVWLHGLPGAGRSHALERVARGWPHAVLWLSGSTWPRRDVLQPGLERPLVCVDDAPVDLPVDGWRGAPVVAAGAHAPPGWSVVPIPPPPADAAVALFLEHAPGAEPLSAVRDLVRTLGGHPLAVVAAARRWPLEALDDLLRDPVADPSALRASFAALPPSRQAALLALASVHGAVPREGAEVLGVMPDLADLVARGWLRLPAPGWVEVSPIVRLSLPVEAPPGRWTAWLASEAERRLSAWEDRGGDREWLVQVGAGWAQAAPTPAVLAAWSLSGATPAALLEACGGGHPRAAARALRALGQTRGAIARLTPPGDPAAQRERGVLHHRLRDLESAEADYRAAGGSPRGRALCLANLAAVHHDRGALREAASAYAEARVALEAVGDTRLVDAVAGNQGALAVELGDLDAARRRLGRAAAGRDPRLAAIATVNLAGVDLLEGLLASAADRYTSVLSAFDDDPVSCALCRARLAGALALLGDLPQARAQHAAARAQIASTDDRVSAQVVELWRGPVELAEGDRAGVVRRIAAARQGPVALVDRSDDARLAVRLLERRLADRADALCVGPAGAWFRLPGHGKVDVSRFAAPARLLAALAAAAEQSPGRSLSGDDLFEAGWPDVSIRDDAARNRLKVALAKLRKLGLGDVILRDEGGWLLDPAWPILRLRQVD